METQINKLDASLQQAIALLEKTQVDLAEKVDALLEQMGTVSSDIVALQKQLALHKGGATTTADFAAITDDEDDSEESKSSLDELANFDADDDLSDDDLERMGYDIK
jgi:hypothetical protein